MSLCPCGCGKEAKTKQGWAGRGCYLRAMPREERAAQSKRKSEAWGRDHYRQLAAKASHARFYKAMWDDLLDKWLDDDVRPADALKEAYTRGYRTGYNAGKRGHKRSKEHWAA